MNTQIVFVVCVPIFGHGGCGRHEVRSADVPPGQCGCGGIFINDQAQEKKA